MPRGNIQLRTVHPVGFHGDPGKAGKCAVVQYPSISGKRAFMLLILQYMDWPESLVVKSRQLLPNV